MTKPETRRYLAHEFAERAGVTVRTLHHYDRLGLLRPAAYTEAGYRLYGESELARLEQIVALKLVGFPLRQIKELLDQSTLELPAALRFQRQIVEEKRRRLDQTLQAIAEAEWVLANENNGRWDALKKIIEVIEMSESWDWVKRYYTQEQLDELAKRGTPEVLARGQQAWSELIREVEAAVGDGEDPASEKAQALASRWQALIEEFTGGNPEIRRNLERLYADRANWPASPRPELPTGVSEFIQKAMAAGKGKDESGR